MPLARTLLCLIALLHSAAAAVAAPIDYERLAARLEAAAKQDDIVGLAVAVVEDGEINFAEGFGQTRLTNGARVTENTVFRWASLSKGVAGATAAILDSEGALSLSNTVASFGSSLQLPGDGELRATLIDVLTHRLGIVSNAYDTRLEDGRDPAGIRGDLAGLKSLCGIGDCHTYQNVAFDAISEAVEAVEGVDYAAAVARRLFAPLRMDTASFGRAALEASESWARPYSKRRAQRSLSEKRVKEPYYRVPAAGGVHGSILVRARFAQALMGRAPGILSANALQAIQLPRVRTIREQRGQDRRYGRLKNAHYGLGMRIYDYAGRRVVGHRGAVEGYRALILFDPALETGVVALWNSNSRRPIGVQFEIFDQVYDLDRRDWLGVDEFLDG